jgi:hypothetical protein
MATMNSSSFKKFKFELGVSEILANFLHWKENKIEFKLEKEIKKISIFLAQKIPSRKNYVWKVPNMSSKRWSIDQIWLL